MTKEEFSRLVSEAVHWVIEQCGQEPINLVVEVIEKASQADDEAVSRGAIAFFIGYTRHEQDLGLSGQVIMLPSRIAFIQDRIEACIENQKLELSAFLRNVAIHELAHYFGISHERMQELGVG